MSSGRFLLLRFLAAIFAVAATMSSAAAHEVRPAYLDIREETPGVFCVLLKTPMQGDARLALSAVFSGKTSWLRPWFRGRPAAR